MERIAIISDIHGNLPALEAVFADISEREIERVICLGDLAGKGPSSSEAVDFIQKNCDAVIKGNWDHFIASQKTELVQWHQEVLGRERRDYLNGLPHYFEVYISGKLVRLCHANPNDIFHRTHLSSAKEERMKLFEPTPTIDKEADVIGYGDIHGAHIENFDNKTIFNTGSVGNPLDMTMASYAIIEGKYDSKEIGPFVISIVKLPYDIDKAIELAKASDMPEKEAYIKELQTAIYRGRK